MVLLFLGGKYLPGNAVSQSDILRESNRAVENDLSRN